MPLLVKRYICGGEFDVDQWEMANKADVITAKLSAVFYCGVVADDSDFYLNNGDGLLQHMVIQVKEMVTSFTKFLNGGTIETNVTKFVNFVMIL